MTINESTFRWYKTADVRTRNVRLGFGLTAFFVIVAVIAVLLSYDFIAAAMLVLATASVPVIARAKGRVELLKTGVRVLPRAAFVNTHYTFPLLATVAAVLATLQWLTSGTSDGDVRLPFIAAFFWLGALVSAGTTIRYRGSMVIDAEGMGIEGRFRYPFANIELRLLQERKSAFPHLEVVPRNGPKRLFFPTKYYGLEANSVFSTLRHLAETDEETRRNYSPELIREMLLFRPDREVEVGESIEVRVVAQSEARTA